MNPLVSVITPTLNRLACLQHCLASVKRQSYERIEHIVVDGGSSDGTLEYLYEVSARRPEVRWVSEPDYGMYDAINKGLALARGEILAYLNSDDLYLPWSVEVAVDALERSGADFVYGDLGVLVREKRRQAFFVQFYRSFDARHYTHHATIAQPTVFFRKSVTAQIGRFDTSYRLIGDCEYWLRAYRAGAALHHVDEILAVQVEHEDTLRATRPDQLAGEFERLRAVYGQAVGAPKPRLAAGAARRLHWRGKQLEFLLASRRTVGSGRWSRFGSFLRDHELNVRPGYIAWHLLPAAIRPASVTLVDAAALERLLLPGGAR